MPKLPDYTSLGSTRLPEPSQRIPHYEAPRPFIPDWRGNPGIIMGEAIAKFGRDITNVAAEKYAEYKHVEQAKAAADLSVQVDKLYMQQAQNPDYQNASKEFREQGAALVEQAKSRIPSGLFGMGKDPELFAARASQLIESHALTLDKHAVTMWHNDVVLQGTQTLNELREQALMPGLSEEAKAQKLQHANDIIDSWVQSGIRTPIQGQALKRQYVQEYGKLYGENLPPEQLMDLTKKILPPELPKPPDGSPASMLGRPIAADRKTGLFFDPETGQHFDKGGNPMPPPDTRKGGPGAKVEVPFNSSMLTESGQISAFADIQKQYKPGTEVTITGTGKKFVVPDYQPADTMTSAKPASLGPRTEAAPEAPVQKASLTPPTISGYERATSGSRAITESGGIKANPSIKPPPIKPSPGRSPNLSGVDSRLLDVVSAGATHLPPGYKVTINEGYTQVGHARGSQHHVRGKGAIDVQIWGPDGNKIPNRGKDTTGLYTMLGRAAYAEMLARHPELKGRLAHGSAFGTVPGGNVQDLMHFDLGGERGHLAALISQE